MKRRVRYQVAATLDGFIAGPDGEYDWIVTDPSIDFDALLKQFETAIVGRKTYDLLVRQGGSGALPGLEVVVFSRTLPEAVRPGLRIVNDDAVDVVATLKQEPGGDIWLFGGGELFRSLLSARLVDTVEVAVMPVLLGSGIPLLPPGAATKLVLIDQKVLPRTGIVALSYRVAGSRASGAPIEYVKTGKSGTGRRPSTGRRSSKSAKPGKAAGTKKQDAHLSRSGARAAPRTRRSRRR